MTSIADISQDHSTPTGIEVAFALPERVAADPEMASLYEDLLIRLRAESQGLPMHTVQEILLERIATKYVLMKFYEQNGWPYPRYENELNTQWRELVKEWNRVLSQGHEQLRDAVLHEAEKISLDALELVEDQELRKVLRNHFKERYIAIGF